MARNTPQTQDPEPTPDAGPVPGEFNPEVNRLLTFAQGLAGEKEALFKRIDANRQILRNYKSIGLLSDEQSVAVDEFYPVPKRTKKGEDAAEGAATEDAAAETATA